MKRMRIIIMLLVLLMLNGCGNEANVPFSESKAPSDAVAVAEEKDPGIVTDVSSQIVIRESVEDTDMKEPEAKSDETADLPDSKQPDDKSTESPIIFSQPVSDQSGEAVYEDPAPEEDTTEYPVAQDSETEPETVTESESETIYESETETESDQPVDPPPEESESEPITEPEPAFDIEYWISYAMDTAAGLGLEFDSSAVDCWDNPITANPDCIYLERDITARLSRYAGDEDITAVWIWYENIGTNKYLIYIGYA